MPIAPGIDPICGSVFRLAPASPLSGDQFRSRLSRRAVADSPPVNVCALLERHVTQFLPESKDLDRSKRQFIKKPVAIEVAPDLSNGEKMRHQLKVLGLACVALAAFVALGIQRAVGTFETDAESHLRFTEKGSQWRLSLGLNTGHIDTVAFVTRNPNNPITGKTLLRPVGPNNDTNQRETKSQKQLPGSAGIAQLHKCLA